ncbi:MAG: isochorismatase family protein [Methylomonas sp.]|nr:isochorismatase family protein [Methylomonas sp.]
MNNKKNTVNKIELGIGEALLVIDIQRDFLPGGHLAVADGEQVVPVMNEYIDCFIRRQLPVFATRDWHPKNHYSFIRQGGIWPEHCVADSSGAEFANNLYLPAEVCIISKGEKADTDGYSGFNNPALKQQLEALNVSRLFIGGLATDYCVLNTVCDALDLNYRVFLLTDAMRAVNRHERDGERAVKKMLLKGAIPISFEMIK